MLASHQQRLLNEAVIPLFEVIIHDKAASSPMLETSISAIFSFLYGSNGKRTIVFFKWLADMLADPTFKRAGDPVNTVKLALAVLSKVMDVNSEAQINQGLHPIVETLGTVLGAEDERGDTLNKLRARKYLERIEKRMGIGLAIPTQAEKKAAIGTVRYEQIVDPPGSLSSNGTRHDNDHEHIRDIKIMPTALDIQSDRPEYLPSTDLTQLHLPGIEGLLDRHLRLLREDTIGQLRDAIKVEWNRSSVLLRSWRPEAEEAGSICCS